MGFSHSLSKNKVLFIFVISAFLILMNAGCTRKAGGMSTLQITLPMNLGSNKISDFAYTSQPTQNQSVSIQSTESGPKWNITLNPMNYTEVDCIMIAITGPEPELQRNLCTTTDNLGLKIGKWVGGIPKGNTLSLEVPSGHARDITIIGFKTQNGACQDFRNNSGMDQNVSEPHILGHLVKDLPTGTVNVTIPVESSNYNTLRKIVDCKGPDFNSDGMSMYFGDATSGDGVTTITANETYTSLGGASQRISAFDPSLPNSTELTVSSESGFSVGNEVMLIIQAQNGSWVGTGDSSVGPCGFRAWDGRYMFGRVVATTPGKIEIAKGTFIDKLHFDPTGVASPSNVGIINGNLLSNEDTSSTFCHMKVLKVLHFFDLDIQTGYSISADSFGFGTHYAGILPIRVNGTLTLHNGSKINVSDQGFQTSSTKNGGGLSGYDPNVCTGGPMSPTRTGGTCSLAGNGAGGGGHGNTTVADPFGPSGGVGGGGASGGSGAGENCGDGSCFGNLTSKLFLGGAGGSSTTMSGGNGGGIAYVAARNVIVPATESAEIKVNGTNGGGTISAIMGAAGGGAAGSILLSYKNLNLNSTGQLLLTAKGGDGGVATGASSSGGGGGGGGRIHVIGCMQSTNPYTALTLNEAGGTNGWSATGTNGAGGLMGSFAQYAPDCANMP